MPTVNDVLRIKGQSIVSIQSSATAREAVRLMNDHRIGAVLVMQNGKMVGIFTERDVLTRVVVPELSPHEVLVADVMSANVVCCNLFSDLDDVAEAMRSRRIRHVPVKDVDDRIVGMVSIGDINAFNIRHKQATIDNMTDYICGRS